MMLFFFTQDFDISLLEECIFRGIEETLQLTAKGQNPEVINVGGFETGGRNPKPA